MKIQKETVALNSVAAAGFLTRLKAVAGLWGGSIGILAESVHSGLDSVAALATDLAVRVAGRPADSGRLYGQEER